jgi:hypothetical protein
LACAVSTTPLRAPNSALTGTGTGGGVQTAPEDATGRRGEEAE